MLNVNETAEGEGIARDYVQDSLTLDSMLVTIYVHKSSQKTSL